MLAEPDKANLSLTFRWGDVVAHGFGLAKNLNYRTLEFLACDILNTKSARSRLGPRARYAGALVLTD